MFQHIEGHEEHDAEALMSMKMERIDEIKASGNEVQHIIHRHGLTEKQSFEVEVALIEAYDSLTNTQGGHYNSERGSMNYDDMVYKYGIPPILSTNFF